MLLITLLSKKADLWNQNTDNISVNHTDSDYDIEDLPKLNTNHRVNPNDESKGSSTNTQIESTLQIEESRSNLILPKVLFEKYDFLEFTFKNADMLKLDKYKEKFRNDIEIFIKNPFSQVNAWFSESNINPVLTNNKRFPKWAIVKKMKNADEVKSCNLNHWNWLKEISLDNKRIKISE